jgi:hypothetical protein
MVEVILLESAMVLRAGGGLGRRSERRRLAHHPFLNGIMTTPVR